MSVDTRSPYARRQGRQQRDGVVISPCQPCDTAPRRGLMVCRSRSSLAGITPRSRVDLGVAKAGSVRIEPSTISGVCNRWRCHFGLSATTERDRGFADSLLEEDGFEPSVPLGREVLERSNISTRWVLLQGGTEGSNPSSSSEESATNRSRRRRWNAASKRRDRWFESSSLQGRVCCETGSNGGAEAAVLVGTVCGSRRARHPRPADRPKRC
jgi:hypothetical protein